MYTYIHIHMCVIFLPFSPSSSASSSASSPLGRGGQAKTRNMCACPEDMFTRNSVGTVWGTIHYVDHFIPGPTKPGHRNVTGML